MRGEPFARATDMIPLMKLNVLPTDAAPWYAEGLKFTCTQCGQCCTGGPGYVWVTDEEVRRVAEHLRLTFEETRRRYCRKIGGRVSFKERRQPNGDHDCIFLQEIPAPAGQAQGAKELAPGAALPVKRRGCSIYGVRPLQCRTWPFWADNLESKERWDHTARRCPGMNDGRRHFSVEQIHAIRDATDWPQNPPTSGAKG